MVRQAQSSWFIARKDIVFDSLFWHIASVKFLTFSVNSAALDDLGVQSGDYVVIHDDTVYLEGINDLDTACKAVYDAAGVTLTFNLTQCNPTVVVSLVKLLQIVSRAGIFGRVRA